MPEGQFPHLALVQTSRGRAVLHGGGSKNAEVKRNRTYRSLHASDLKRKFQGFSASAKESVAKREEEQLPTISGGVPFVLRIPDEDDQVMDFVARKLNLEIVAEYDDGFLIVATEDLDLQEDETARFTLAVSFEALEGGVEVYEDVRVAVEAEIQERQAIEIE